MKKIIFLTMFMLCSCSSTQQNPEIDDKDKLSLSLQVGSLDKAMSIAIDNYAKDPQSIESGFALSDIYYKQGKYEMQYRLLSQMMLNVNKDSENFIELQIRLMQNSLKRNDFNNTILIYNSIKASSFFVGTQQGKAMEYAGIAMCKNKDFTGCLQLLNGAMRFLPGDLAIIDNINIANYMQSNDKGHSDINNLYLGYNDSRSPAMFANLVMALIKDNKETQAYKLLSLHYSSNDSLKIIEELKTIHDENKT